MKNIKQNKGITLVALIITIIVLLILAVVAISAVQGDGIIAHAKNARDDYQTAQSTENSILADYQTKLDNANGENGAGGNNGGGTVLTAAEAKTEGKAYASNTVITDEYGNKITIPAGFKLASDSGENVTQGIVIEDVNNGNAGSQFVWVPCGIIYTNAAKTESKTITLSRYTFDSSTGTPTAKGDEEIITGGGHYQELATSSYGNTTADNIGNFIQSVTDNGGYYIGRYEAGDSSATSARSSSTEGTLVCKANQEVYNYIAQPNAATKCRNMYTSSNFTSDLVNSYAWDTAVVYIQTFGEDSKYSINNHCTSFTKTGINPDKYCNIYDMSGNVMEWITETCSQGYSGYPYVAQGGIYDTYSSRTNSRTSGRNEYYGSYSYGYGFRPLLYV